MKNFKLIFIALIAFSMFGIFACNSSSDNQNNENIDSTEIISTENNVETLDSTENVNAGNLGNEYTAKYICPNHCKGSGSDKEGECPVCGMELMENPNFEAK
ncbi:MAG: hypothetical protein JXR51_05760 [Bacteroidales bacterium]|nr:hypothetical protein [Bacteroidales bacterium]MBN2756666.1 hypothetical protein [Bacteroidales bacterium]